MNTLVKALLLSMSTALVAAPVMAAPQDHPSQQNSHQVQQQHHAPAQHQAQNNHKQPTVHQSNSSVKHKSIHPSRDWKVGQKVPSQYQTSNYKVDYSKHKKLHQPARNQQWFKVNNDYVLTNVISHSILKIIAG